MSTLQFETLRMPGAPLGNENPYPPIQQTRDIHHSTKIDGDFPEEMLANLRRGHLPNIMPYRLQDGYSRQRTPRDYNIAVLENDHLRAEFLLDYGGRLWSLFDKDAGKELLFKNEVLQPANLALRNAWFCGGVEWNIGMTGHTPFTCSPLFAAEIDSGYGFPILRMWEWERIRNTPYVIDAFLPPDSRQLLVKIRIINPNDLPVPMYWWSNMAAPETPGVRVVVPAEHAFQFGYQRAGLSYIPTPVLDGIDYTYPEHIDHSADFFFDIPAENHNWITAIDASGEGIFEISTRRLKGRKLFVWGQGNGGKNWQRFLAPQNPGYLEIQAGLAATQLEHLEMPANTEWVWLEAYGHIQTDPNQIHHQTWQDAVTAVEEAICADALVKSLDDWLTKLAPTDLIAPAHLTHHGSSWGAIETLWRTVKEQKIVITGITFPDDQLEAEGLDYLRSLVLNEQPKNRSGNFQPVIDPKWVPLIEQLDPIPAPLLNILGLIYHYMGDHASAEASYRRSLELDETVQARRNLAVLFREQEKHDQAVNCYQTALEQAGFDENLFAEAGSYLLSRSMFDQCFHLFAPYPEHKLSGRLKLIRALAAVEISELEIVEHFFEKVEEVDTMREGEVSTSDLWLKWHRKQFSEIATSMTDEEFERWVDQHHPIHPDLDFRMKANTTD